MPDPNFDLKSASRYFAIALNQRAFELVGKEVRNAAEDDELLYAAYGSACSTSPPTLPQCHALPYAA